MCRGFEQAKSQVPREFGPDIFCAQQSKRLKVVAWNQSQFCISGVTLFPACHAITIEFAPTSVTPAQSAFQWSCQHSMHRKSSLEADGRRLKISSLRQCVVEHSDSDDPMMLPEFFLRQACQVVRGVANRSFFRPTARAETTAAR